MSDDADEMDAPGPAVLHRGELHPSEGLVIERLRSQLPADAVIIHGQRITTAEADVEIDVLVLWPGVGIVVLEVKGGQVRVEDGTWSTSGRGGTHALRRSPLEQAMTAKHALLGWLRPRMSRRAGRMVHMACLPFTNTRSWDCLLYTSDAADE